MIELSKLNGEKYFVNPELIEIIEITPDTKITMTNGKTHFALETPREVIDRIDAYKIRILQSAKSSRKRVVRREE